MQKIYQRTCKRASVALAKDNHTQQKGLAHEQADYPRRTQRQCLAQRLHAGGT